MFKDFWGELELLGVQYLIYIPLYFKIEPNNYSSVFKDYLGILLSILTCKKLVNHHSCS